MNQSLGRLMLATHRLLPINPTGVNTFRNEFYFQRLIPQRASRICPGIQQAPPTYPSPR